MKRISVLLLSVFLLQACAVGMAVSGKQNPDLGAVRVGSSRGEVQMHLGQPSQSIMNDDGTRTDVYEYEIGNEPSAGRAIGHGVMDVLTLCLWEVVGTPIESVQGDKYKATILYDKDDKLMTIRTEKVGS